MGMTPSLGSMPCWLSHATAKLATKLLSCCRSRRPWLWSDCRQGLPWGLRRPFSGQVLSYITSFMYGNSTTSNRRCTTPKGCPRSATNRGIAVLWNLGASGRRSRVENPIRSLDLGRLRWAIGARGEQAADVETFFETHEVPQGRLVLEQHLEKMRVNVALREREAKRLADAV